MAESVKYDTVSWVDLSTPAIAEARQFYGDLLGWDLAESDTPMGTYIVASAGGRQAAGMMAQPPELAGQPAIWTTYLWVEDIHRTISAVTRSGGRVLAPPSEIPGGAQVAIIADPSGAMLGIIAGGPEPGSYFSEARGAVCWAELMTRRTDAATTFYRDSFGWNAATDDAGGVAYTVFSLDQQEVAGMIETPADVPADVPDSWSVYFAVDDCRAAEQRALDLGGSVILPTTPTPAGPFAVIADPQGAVFQLMEMQTTAGADTTGS